MRNILFFLLFASLSTSLFAQDKMSTFQEESDPRATAILDKIKAEYDGHESIEAKFSLSIELPEQPEEIQNGMIAQKGEKYHVDMGAQSIYSDGNNIWLHLKTQNEVQISTIEEDAEVNMLSPTELMKIYEGDQFIYFLVNDGNEKGKSIQYIEFKPTDKYSDYSKLRLKVDKAKNRVLQIKAFAKDGSRYTLDIKSFEVDKAFSDKDFVFDESKFPEISVEDLRID